MLTESYVNVKEMFKLFQEYGEFDELRWKYGYHYGYQGKPKKYCTKFITECTRLALCGNGYAQKWLKEHPHD